MKPAAFDYVIADSIDMAVASLAYGGGDAKIIAGGQSLVPMLNFRLLRPSILVDINRIGDLAFIQETGKNICVGALTRHFQLETSPVIARHLPILACAMTHVAHLAIRNRGTIGGSLAHADPAAELPMMALLLDAELSIASTSGKRTIAARDFFLDALTVDLAGGDIVTEIVMPKLPPETGWGFYEVARRSGDFALAAAAATLT
ncbi:MAG: FAD binding domain-containing protein, partial [Pseudolabrys sp.]